MTRHGLLETDADTRARFVRDGVAERSRAPADPAAHLLTRMRLLPDGAPFRDPAFPQLRP